LSERLESDGRAFGNDVIERAVMGRVLDLHSKIQVPELVGAGHEVDCEHDEAFRPRTNRDVAEQ
jgi:hypothetical protein